MNYRVNLILVIVALACALSIVASNHRARKLFIELDREQERMHALDIEWGQLQLEQSTWANHARVEKIAHEKLQMKTPPPAVRGPMLVECLSWLRLHIRCAIGSRNPRSSRSRCRHRAARTGVIKVRVRIEF